MFDKLLNSHTNGTMPGTAPLPQTPAPLCTPGSKEFPHVLGLGFRDWGFGFRGLGFSLGFRV